MEVHLYNYFRWCGYFLSPRVLFVRTDEFSVRVKKITLRIGVSQQDAPFHRIAYDYSSADWDSLHDHLRHIPWEDIFKACVRYF